MTRIHGKPQGARRKETSQLQAKTQAARTGVPIRTTYLTKNDLAALEATVERLIATLPQRHGTDLEIWFFLAEFEPLADFRHSTKGIDLNQYATLREASYKQLQERLDTTDNTYDFQTGRRSEEGLTAVVRSLRVEMDRGLREYGTPFVTRFLVQLNLKKLGKSRLEKMRLALERINPFSPSTFQLKGLYKDEVAAHNDRAAQLKTDLPPPPGDVVLTDETTPREGSLPTAQRPTKRPVNIQTFVSETTRDEFNKLSILTGQPALELLGDMIERAVEQRFVPPVTKPAGKNEFAIQAIVKEATREKAKELARLNRISAAELLRRLIEYTVEQDFVREMTDALDKARSEARTRVLKSIAPSASFSKARPR